MVVSMAVNVELGAAVHYEITQVLHREADLLDNNMYREWIAMLAADLIYRMPVRITRERTAGLGYSEEAFHFDDDYRSLVKRVERLETEYAWAEDPPSRTMRMVTNVIVNATDKPDEVAVKSNLLVFRGRYDSADYQLIAVARQDIFRKTGDQWLLARRTILPAQTTLAVNNLAVFL